VYIALGGGRMRPGYRLGVANSSAQVSDGSGHAAKDCDRDMTGRSGREEASSRHKTGLAMFQRMAARRRPLRPPGSWGDERR
jgi:hypothetical protein